MPTMALALVLVAPASFALGFVCARGVRSRAGALALAVACIGAAALWALLFAYYLHTLDGALYYAWRAHPLTDLVAGLVGFPLGAVAAREHLVRADGSRRPTPSAPAASAGVLVSGALVVVAFAKPWLFPLPLAQIEERWRDDVCLQSTQATCGPCSAATALRSLGVDVGERALADESDTTVSGTLNWLLIRAIRARGVSARFTEPATIDEVRAPAIVGVGVGTLGHFVAYLGTTPSVDPNGDPRGDLVIGEPLKGRVVMTRAAFAARYQFKRFALELTRPGAPAARAAAAAAGSN